MNENLKLRAGLWNSAAIYVELRKEQSASYLADQQYSLETKHTEESKCGTSLWASGKS